MEVGSLSLYRSSHERSPPGAVELSAVTVPAAAAAAAAQKTNSPTIAITVVDGVGDIAMFWF